MSHVTQDLVTSIDERLAHARAEIASLEAALAVFDTPAVPVRERQPTRGLLTAVTPISTTGQGPRSANRTPAQSQPSLAHRAHAHGSSPTVVTWTPSGCKRCSANTTD
jgi:hypothetical protein